MTTKNYYTDCHYSARNFLRKEIKEDYKFIIKGVTKKYLFEWISIMADKLTTYAELNGYFTKAKIICPKEI